MDHQRSVEFDKLANSDAVKNIEPPWNLQLLLPQTLLHESTTQVSQGSQGSMAHGPHGHARAMAHGFILSRDESSRDYGNAPTRQYIIVSNRPEQKEGIGRES